MKGAYGKARLGTIALLSVAAFAIMAAAAAAPRASMAAKHPATIAAPKANAPSAAAKLHVADLYGKLPLRFERNDGQTDARAKFLSRGDGYMLFLTPTEAVLALRKPGKASRPDSSPPSSSLSSRAKSAKSREPGSGIFFDKLRTGSRAAATRENDRIKDDVSARVESEVVRVKIVGGNPNAQIQGVDQLAGKSNYFIGNDPKKWHTDVPNYSKVELKGVYPRIDLIYHGGKQGQLEYDFRLAPGADPKAIRLSFRGAGRLALDRRGDLIVSAGKSKLVEQAPEIYQEIGGMRAVKGGWVLRGAHEAGFRVARYDRTKPIVIDPVLLYSTYLGGSGAAQGHGIAVDSAGFAYVTGTTGSTDFPVTPGAFQTANAGGNAFVTKLNANGTGLAYSTYLGGSSYDSGSGIAVDSSGFAYVTGTTNSTDFPTLNAYQSTCPSASGSNGCQAAFVAKLNPSASGAASLLYGTYLGGSGSANGSDQANGIGVDSAGNAYVTGITNSTDFPTLNAFQSSCASASGPYGCQAAFVAKLNPSASGAASLLYSTYLGGSTYDSA